MGQFFVDRAHYAKTDHFTCMIEGTAHLRLVPHINRHEIYAGQSYYEQDEMSKEHGNSKADKNGKLVKIEAFESPVNMFSWDKESYPNVNMVHHKYGEVLSAGDCIYVPAFYFVQTAAEADQ